MKSEIIDVLSKITKEEQDILNGRDVDMNLYMGSEENIIDSHKLLENGKLIHIRPHTRFVHFPAHSHNYVEIIYMCKGSTTHIVNGEKIVLNEGELLFLNQNAIQEIMPAGEDDIAVNFIVQPVFFDRALQMMAVEENPIRTFILDCMLGKDDKIGYLHFKVADVLPIQNLVENLIWSILNEQMEKRSINQITMGLLILQLMNMSEKLYTGKGNASNEVLLKVYRYIEENYKDGQLRELAKILGQSEYELSRFIKKSTGLNYTDLCQKKRLSQAMYLLKNTKMSINDIGECVGYDNSSYFYRLFKKEVGQSPKEYRLNSQTPS